jgi:uncharacterized protein
MDKLITDFISSQTVASVCCLDENNRPYCFSCFYAFDREKQLLYFKTSPASQHVKMLLKNHLVGGTIQQDKLNPFSIRGIQFSGVAYWQDGKVLDHASILYHARHPVALTMDGEIWTIQLHKIKMSINSLGMNKKVNWQCSDTTKNDRNHTSMKATNSI